MRMYYGQYTEHESAEPIAADEFIWRYMSLFKLVSILANRSLYFASIESLREADPFEGAWSIGHWKDVLAHGDQNAIDDLKLLINQIEGLREGMLPYTYANCWHVSSYESQAMWRLYGDEIAIRSTFGQLSNCFRSGKGQSIPVIVGKVQYIDYSSDRMSQDDISNFLTVPLRKDRSFAYEHELRAVLFYPQQADVKKAHKKPLPGQEVTLPPPSKGLAVRIDPNVLIESIFLSPKVPDWYADLVLSITRKYRFDIPVRLSELNIVPRL